MASREYKREAVGCVSVEPRQAEMYRRLLKDLLDRRYKVEQCGLRVCFPVTSVHEALKVARENGVDASPCERRFTPSRRVEGIGRLFPSLDVHSYVLVGDIALFHPRPGHPLEELREPASYLVEAMGVKSVYAKLSTVGEERKAKLVLLAGTDNPVTVHREYGLSFQVDVSAAYVNPRLGFERRLVAGEVEPGELVLDLFSGVGGHSIHVASLREAHVVAADINPTAVYLQARNILLNKKRLKGRIDLYMLDARYAPQYFKPVFDRIIADNPTMHARFIGVECSLSREGTIIHHYLVGGEEPPSLHVARLFEDEGCRVRVENTRRVLPYSPRTYIWRMDLRVEKPSRRL